MSAAQESKAISRLWWRPFHLSKQLAASAALALLLALGSWYLIEVALAPYALDDGVLPKNFAFYIGYVCPAAIALLIFDGCWQTALFGGNWREALLTPLRSRFWYFALAWTSMDLFFFCALDAVRSAQDVASKANESGGGVGWMVIAYALLAVWFALIAVRLRLILWPMHVFATGRLLDFKSAWIGTRGKIENTFGLMMGLFVFALVALFVSLTALIFIIPLTTATVLATFIAVTLSRSLLLSTLFEVYMSGPSTRLDPSENAARIAAPAPARDLS